MSSDDGETYTVALVARERDGYRFFDLRIPVDELHPTDEALRALNEDATERFVDAAVGTDHAVAEVRLDEDGAVVDVAWFDSPRPPGDATDDHPESQDEDAGVSDPSGGVLDRLRSVFR